MTKKSVFYKLCIVLIPVFLLTCCNNGSNDTEDTKAAFLSMYFTMDSNGRYGSLEEAGLTEAGIEEYYRELSELTTEEFLATLQANREPYSYDKFAAENGIRTEVASVLLEPYGEEKNVFSYTVILKAAKDGETKKATAEGQITVEEQSGKELVSSLYISPSVRFLDFPE